MTRGRAWLLAAFAAAAVPAVLAYAMWRGGGAGHVGAAVDPGNAELVALGGTIYARDCAACHGAERQGQPNWQSRLPDGLLPAPPLDGSAHTWHHGDDLLFAIVRDGPAAHGPPGYRSAMPPFGGRLTEREIAAVLSFIKNRWPPRARAAQDEITRRSRAGG